MGRQSQHSTLRAWAVSLCLLVAGWSVAAPAWALPVFARREQLSCTTCHAIFPELNAVGRTYKENGYRFLDGQKPKANGEDLGAGIIIDKIPGLAIRLESVPVEIAPNDAGDLEVNSVPLDAVEIFSGGNSGTHWSYFAELGASAEDGYSLGANGLVQYRFAQALSLYGGWTAVFSREGYNTLSGARNWGHADHAATDYTGSVDVGFGDEGAWLGGYGRISKLYYNVAVGPGPGIPEGFDNPDVMARVAVDVASPLAIGAFVYSANTDGDDTLRVGADVNAMGGFGLVKVVGMYDTLDELIAVEAAWDKPFAIGDSNVYVLPEARVDVTVGGDSTIIAPTVGVGVQHSTGRAYIEVTEPLGGDSTPPPTTTLVVDTVF